jgi:hypothetical protein
MSIIHSFKSQEGLVIFAGAGCSIAPPSSLPGWNSLNDTILDILWDRLEPYGLNKNIREKILTSIKHKRDENTFPPDYQAQLMVERAGIKYFELLSGVDSDTYNAVQYYTAILAEAGLVRAVVTTNFDKNFERAFSHIGIPYKSYFNEEGFNSISINDGLSLIPVIKIHGCCSSAASMVDTRKQRLKGRAKSLENLMLQLFNKHHVIFCGFSGQDFDDNKNYLGLRDAAPDSKGFTYLYLPGTVVRESMACLINFYGENKAQAVASDPALYLEGLIKNLGIPFEIFVPVNQDKLSIRDRLKIKIDSIEPMDAINMLTSLTESYGDEIIARYLLDKVWRERFHEDYDGDALSRFLLSHGRSYIFNFQSKKERAKNAGVFIDHIPIIQGPPGADEIFINPAKKNLNHIRNTSPETIGLIALGQTYYANPILFDDFPHNLIKEFLAEPTKTEIADIIYYYSFYALLYGKIIKGLEYLNSAVKIMEEDFDEPRLSQLLSRRALIKLKIKQPDLIESSKEDALRSRELAAKYHEPQLLALSALALATLARKKEDFESAFKFIQEAVKYYSDLKRIPQYIESIVEYLKIIMLGLNINAASYEMLLKIVSDIKNKVESYIVERINVFEPEYCYLMGMITGHFNANISRSENLKWFADAISLAQQFKLENNYNYFRETCKQLQILDEIEKMINQS